MNITMFLMIHLCVKVRRNNNIMRARERVFSGKKRRMAFPQFPAAIFIAKSTTENMKVKINQLMFQDEIEICGKLSLICAFN